VIHVFNKARWNIVANEGLLYPFHCYMRNRLHSPNIKINSIVYYRGMHPIALTIKLQIKTSFATIDQVYLFSYNESVAWMWLLLWYLVATHESLEDGLLYEPKHVAIGKSTKINTPCQLLRTKVFICSLINSIGLKMLKSLVKKMNIGKAESHCCSMCDPAAETASLQWAEAAFPNHTLCWSFVTNRMPFSIPVCVHAFPSRGRPDCTHASPSLSKLPSSVSLSIHSHVLHRFGGYFTIDLRE
jgi:hypothetical protein